MIQSTLHPLHRVLGGVQILAALTLLGLILVLLAGILPSLLGFESFVVLSGSMVPALQVGDLAVVQPTKSQDLKVGDVVTYRTAQQPDVVVTHRLVSIGHDAKGRLEFVTKGDANNVTDRVPVDQGAVLGRVAYALPRLGYLVAFSQRTEGKLLLLVIPGVLLAADYLRDRLSRRRATSAALEPSDTLRVRALLDRGRRALESGQTDLAMQAANGVLESEPRNEDAWLLKAEATPDPAARLALLQTALAVNPRAERIVSALQTLQAEHAAA